MTAKKRYHFIAIGGSIMHSLAIALKQQGHNVTGSDDAIYGVSKMNLEEQGILPDEMGWFEDKIDKNLDSVILGMHAKAGNPELVKAQKLGVPVYSFPEFIYQHSISKKRIVITGSHGKTSISAMIIHSLNALDVEFDYILGAPPSENAALVKITDAPVIILEGDEYLTSPLDKRPKFLHYHPHISVISGVSWDHANVFPTEEIYSSQFMDFINLNKESGTIIYNQDDEILSSLIESGGNGNFVPYKNPQSNISDGITRILTDNQEIPLKIFGEHNMYNLGAAMEVVQQLGFGNLDFLKSIGSFKGAYNRLQLVAEAKNRVFSDFAHSPSKVRATVNAVSNQFPKNRLFAILEIHTFSSLNKSFLPQYKGSLENADVAIVYYDPDVVKKKKLPSISASEIKNYFNQDIFVFTDPTEMKEFILNTGQGVSNFLFMSSGNFGGIDIRDLANVLKTL